MYQAERKGVVVLDPSRVPSTNQELHDQIAGYIRHKLDCFKNQRGDLEDIWLESWAHYFGTTEGLEYLREQTLIRVGNVNNDWRHNINVGKAYEIVETIHGYLMAAIFPNTQWFNFEANMPTDPKLARVMRKYFAQKLTQWNFRSHFGNYLRQLIVTGSSTFAILWNGKSIDFKVLDNFETFFDPMAESTEDSPFIRVTYKTREDIILGIRSGYYECEEWDVVQFTSAYDTDLIESDSNRVRRFQGLETDYEFGYQDRIRVIEYWGCLYLDGLVMHNMYCEVMGNTLIHMEENPYASSPFVFGSYVPVVRQPHGMGAFQAALGSLHQLNITNNQRLDNAELVINQMWKKKASSPLRTEDISSEPGKVFEVNDMDDVEPMQTPNTSVVVGLQEQTFITDSIEQSTGTGALISTGQPRGGERVTATEVSMVREAGGNRLSNVHKHIESTQVLKMLSTTVDIVRQFERTDEIIRIAGPTSGGFDYYQVGPREIRNLDFTLKPRGADYIIEQKEYIERRTALIQLVTQIPQFSQLLDYKKIFLDLLMNWGFEEPEAYMVEEKPVTPEQRDPVQQMGGEALQNAMAMNQAVDGGNTMLKNTTGLDLKAQGAGLNVSDLIQQYLAAAGDSATRGVPLQPDQNAAPDNSAGQQ